MSNACRDGRSGGRIVASGDEIFTRRKGDPSSKSSASVGISTASGRAITASERRTQNPPWVVSSRGRLMAKRSILVPTSGEQCRQERQRGHGRPGHDDDPGYPDRAQEHELEQRQTHQADQDRRAGEEDRFARRGDRPLHRQGHVAAIPGQLLAVARGDEQRVVDR